MGGRGSFLASGGFGTPAQWHSEGLMYGVKVLKRNDPKSRISLPERSNTPGAAYVAVNQEGKFHQYRQFKNNRFPAFDIDYGVDKPLTGKDRALHIHEYDKEANRLPGRWLTKKEYDRYKKFFKGVA